jgi:hypothetical protein
MEPCRCVPHATTEKANGKKRLLTQNINKSTNDDHHQTNKKEAESVRERERERETTTTLDKYIICRTLTFYNWKT